MKQYGRNKPTRKKGKTNTSRLSKLVGIVEKIAGGKIAKKRAWKKFACKRKKTFAEVPKAKNGRNCGKKRKHMNVREKNGIEAIHLRKPIQLA